ncbi:MAG: dTDP-4-dehydrorhamnose reductase [Candidatus Sericytochromatia bacterium]|nr:dTDP-4-dehydrorhamnose reductase [Candidatus Sericytochromatia bacterium]
MRVLITGAGGMLGQALGPVFAAAGHHVMPLRRTQLDVTEAREVDLAFAELRPELVIHAAAYTQVDRAEAEPHIAEAINRFGTAIVAEVASRHRAPVVYLSTDYVFDGTWTTPIPADAPVAPINAYGRTKWQGEEVVLALQPEAYIVRTSWLYGAGGPNFVDTMRQLAVTRPQVRVVTDQIGSPTWTVALSRMLVDLVATGAYGIYHASGQGSCSWYGLAEAIWAQMGYTTPLLTTTSDSMGRPAPRPAYSVLDVSKLEALRIPVPTWQSQLTDYLSLPAG